MKVSFAIALLCVSAVSCTDAGLQPYLASKTAVLDNKLEIKANVCTEPPADTAFPVKILFVVDMSDSMHVTDPSALRLAGVSRLVSRFAGDPSVEFAIVAFGEHINVSAGGFSNNLDANAFFNNQATDGNTDYQGAMGAAYTLLAQDMQNAGPAKNARTKYVLLFFTDGIPDPQCSAAKALAGQFQLGLCTLQRQDWQALARPGDDVTNIYPELQAFQDYNQPYQIYKTVDDLVALQKFYHVGDLELHTALLFDPSTLSNPLAAPENFNITAQTEAEGRVLLTDMAQHGHGTFTEFDSATAINFLNFDYTSIKEPDAMALVFADNTTTVLSAHDQVVDTDGDGLSDAEEFKLKTCVGLGASCNDPADSDGDGYSDWFENLERASGFDPLDAAKPIQKCAGAGRNDSDGDGLRNCEEAYLGTDPLTFDSDADRIPDLIEVKNGLNPLDASDAQADADHDGIRNIDEIRQHTNPQAREPQASAAETHYLYDVASAPKTSDGRTCYDVTIRNVTLMSSGQGTQSPRGDNRVLVYFVEAPTDLPLDFGTLKIACVDARYVDGQLKQPASGKISLSTDNFVDATAFVAARDCIKAAGASAAGKP